MRQINTDVHEKRWHIRGNLSYPWYRRRILTSDAAILNFEGSKVYNSL